MRGHKTQQAVIVSPYKIEKYYKDNLDQYKVGDEIKLRMIFIKRGDKTQLSQAIAEKPACPDREARAAAALP